MCHHHPEDSFGEDSFVITSRQFGIDCCLQCAFQGLVPSFFLDSEDHAVFQLKKESLCPVSRATVTMELSPHPNESLVTTSEGTFG